MKILKNKAFTLVELLVVITILAILSITAYQSFGGATDKAKNTTKKSNITTLGNTLGIFYVDKNYYPMPQEKSITNLWGYTGSTDAVESNTLKVTYTDNAVSTIMSGSGGGVIYGTGTWAKSAADEKQIGAKGVIGVNGAFNKKYIKEKVYDRQLGDIKLTGDSNKTMIDYGIGKFTYAIYARASAKANWNTSGTRGSYYTIAGTFKDLEGEGFKTFLSGNYSKDNFESNVSNYPETLLGLTQSQKDNNVATTSTSQGIPYPIDNFAK